MGDVVVQLDIEGRRVTGRGVATDVVEASARAYLAAVNRMFHVQPGSATTTQDWPE
ncbi:MAG: alpha-isopropylmalate synthase regulatory domain-containing protein [Actinomycetota bacterium]